VEELPPAAHVAGGRLNASQFGGILRAPAGPRPGGPGSAPALDVPPTLRFTVPVGRPPTRVRARSAVGRAPVVVVESSSGQSPADRLDEEFDVLARLPAPVDTSRLTAVIAHYRPRLLLLKHSPGGIDESLMSACHRYDMSILLLAGPTYGLLRPARIRRLGGLPWIRLRWGASHPVGAPVKRCVDVALVLLGAPLYLPLMVLIAIAVSCGGPPLCRQTRIGAGGRLFRMVKFRTTRVGAERESGPVSTSAGDNRITRVGRFLRRTRLDELPQLWNVLRGQMSLVGPRPEGPEFIAGIERLPHHDQRHLIRPGLTGIAQLTGGNAATVEEKLRCDLLYVNCRSLRLDLTLLVLTGVELLRGFARG
jgi:lipopolysaccharide/colanic/teichoic acid biosynthesis glycosyltransferase